MPHNRNNPQIAITLTPKLIEIVDAEADRLLALEPDPDERARSSSNRSRAIRSLIRAGLAARKNSRKKESLASPPGF